MDREAKYKQFISLILSFLFSMFLLVFSGDLLTLFVAWDLLGFSSLFLVIFYRSRSSLGGGLLTGITNRVGDVFLLVLFGLGGTFAGNVNISLALLLILVSITKSAQVPFSSWLPAAILAPTPVSALVHSSTLVTAGVYLLFRFSALCFPLLAWVGVFTTIYAGLRCLFEADIKKVIALSTLSQLGLMMSSLGLGCRSLAFVHLNIHATIKAILFITVGSIIHINFGSQEVRASSGLMYSCPFLVVVMLIGRLSLCGLVFLSAGSSKEPILESSFNSGSSLLFTILFYFGIFLTGAYCFRLILLFCSPLGRGVSLSCLLPTSLPILLPLLFLASGSIMQGIVWGWFSTLCCPIIFGFDKFFVIILFVASLSFSLFFLGLSQLCSSPGRLLSGAVLRLGQFPSLAGTIICTDQVLTSLSRIHSLTSNPGWVSPGSSIFLRSMFFLSLVFLVA